MGRLNFALGTLLIVALLGCSSEPGDTIAGSCWTLDSFDGRPSNVIYCFEKTKYQKYGRNLNGNVRRLGYDDVVEDLSYWFRQDSAYFDGLRFSVIALDSGHMILSDEVGRIWKLTGSTDTPPLLR